MDEVFGNLIYLIPIALIIFRVLSALTGGKKRQKQRRKEEEARRAQAEPVPRPEHTGNEELRKFFKSFGVPEPGDEEEDDDKTEDLPHWEREKTSVPKIPEPKRRQFFPEQKTLPSQMPVHTFVDMSEPKTAARPVPVPKPPSAGQILPGGLSPLQQAFLWSEILGSPKG